MITVSCCVQGQVKPHTDRGLLVGARQTTHNIKYEFWIYFPGVNDDNSHF